jgi:hypothetical protein
VAGCGGDDSGSVSVEAGDLSKKDFVSKADGICVKNRARFTREYKVFAARSLSKARTDKDFSKSDETATQQELVDTILVPNFSAAVDEISELGAPQGDEKEVEEFLEALQTRLDELSEEPSEISNEMFDKPAKIARDYGLTGCATSLTS